VRNFVHRKQKQNSISFSLAPGIIEEGGAVLQSAILKTNDQSN
jgi:hypothetical protein